jgi:uncharacterized membrane protein YphA (DoxX/SURF4 family)
METNPVRNLNVHPWLALLRVVLGIIILATWYENLRKGVYTAEGITDLLRYLFEENDGGPGWYRSLIQNTVLQAPGAFGVFQMIVELLMGVALLFGIFTPVAAIVAAIFFFNLFLAYLGGSEWIWSYVLLTVLAVAVAFTRAGRTYGCDTMLYDRVGRPPVRFLW